MNRVLIALLAHEINRAYCMALGDLSHPSWEDAPEWQQQSVLAGVDMHLAKPDATPEQSHASWLEHKLADGWVFGEVKDEQTKTHPCCLPYDELPAEQKAKDYIFRAAVHLGARLIDELDGTSAEFISDMQAELDQLRNRGAAEVSKQLEVAPRQVLLVGQVTVKYIGRRESWSDRLYGTGLNFTTGQVRTVPAQVARNLLRHRDLFEDQSQDAAVLVVEPEADVDPVDDTAALLQQAQQQQQDELANQNALQDLRDRVMQMDKQTLEDFAKVSYRQEIDKRRGLGALREQVIGFIDQYGVV